MKNKISIVIIIILALWVSFLLMTSFDFRAFDGSKVKLKVSNQVVNIESKPSFHGDGVRLSIYEYFDSEADKLLENIEKNKSWQKTPMNAEVEKVFKEYVQFDHFIQGYLELEESIPIIPDIKNGYYLLIDKDNERRNFAFYIFDLDTLKMYYYRTDM